MSDLWLHDRYDAHEGQPGVLFGKGPSVDLWDFEKASGEVWMTINEACRIFPQADYHIMNDFPVYENLRRVRWKPKDGLIVTRGTSCRLEQVGGEWPGQTLYYGRDNTRIYKSHSTGGSGLQVLAAMGIRQILMVGFDGWDRWEGPEYSAAIGSMPYRQGKGPASQHRWIKVNRDISEALRLTRCEVVWWHREPTRETREVFLPKDRTDSSVSASLEPHA